nr:hypothetical protein [Tanacetum cinerariifolium]
VAQNPRVQNDGIQNQIGNGNLVAVRAEGNAAGHNGNQLRCYNCRGVEHFARDCTIAQPGMNMGQDRQMQMVAQNPRIQNNGNQNQIGNEEYDLMAAATDLDEIEEVNANCILMANLQQASSSGTQTDSTPVYDSDGSAEIFVKSREPGSESRPPMLNKENYVPWSSRLLRYAKSRPNGKLIHNSILDGPYVRRMIPEPGDANRDVNVTETFHEQTDDELSEKELKQIEADNQAIQAILLGLPEDIYAAVDSCETA